MGGRGRERRRRDDDYPNFYNKNYKNDQKARERAENYLGYLNGGDTDKWGESLTEQEIMDIGLYTGSYYIRINEAIRNNNPNSDYWNVGQSVKGALDKSVLSKNIMVHRGDSGKVFGVKGLPQDEMYMRMKLLEGTEMSFTNFVSTSPNRPWTGSVQYHISIPKGKGYGAYVKNYSSHVGEDEFLLNSGLNFKVKRVALNKDFTNEGKVDVWLTLVK